MRGRGGGGYRGKSEPERPRRIREKKGDETDIGKGGGERGRDKGGKEESGGRCRGERLS